MKVLITGADGFVGRNLMAALCNLRDGKDATRPGLSIEEVFGYDVLNDPALLENYCRECDFVFHLAGVNRSTSPEAFAQGNCGFTARLLNTLKQQNNTCPVMFASSLQASLIGRYDNDYGRSKKAGEELLFQHAAQTGAEVLVYRLPHLFGKWCRPHYNSVVATFCHNVANGLPIVADDPNTALELLYIDDLLSEMLNAMEGRVSRCEWEGLRVVPCHAGRYCMTPLTHRVTLGEIVVWLERFQELAGTLRMPEMPKDSFAGKLCATYLSYLPAHKVAVPLAMHTDNRGSFTELLKTAGYGQISVNISRPGVTKGQHWHSSKWEIFIVVSGRGRIRERRIGSDEVLTFEVSGDALQAVYLLPGYTHSITNVSDTEDLVTVMWVNESFDAEHPDTFGEVV